MQLDARVWERPGLSFRTVGVVSVWVAHEATLRAHIPEGVSTGTGKVWPSTQGSGRGTSRDCEGAICEVGGKTGEVTSE